MENYIHTAKDCSPLHPLGRLPEIIKREIPYSALHQTK